LLAAVVVVVVVVMVAFGEEIGHLKGKDIKLKSKKWLKARLAERSTLMRKYP
jgi:hypothetical protein